MPTKTLAPVNYVKKTGDTMTGDLNLGANRLKTTDQLIKTESSTFLAVRNIADSDYSNIRLNSLYINSGFRCSTGEAILETQAANGAYVMMLARQNDVGQLEIAKLAGGVTPAFEIKAGKLTGNLLGNSQAITGDKLLEGDVLMAYKAAEGNTTSAAYYNVRQGRVGKAAKLRVKFDIKTAGGGATAYGRIYKNGVAVGTERSTGETTYQTFSEDIDGWSPGDLVQLYVKTSDGVQAVYYRNFEIYVQEFQGVSVVIP